MKFNEFITERNRLIDCLESKELSKSDYIEQNYKKFVDGISEPSTDIQNLDEGLIAYHYYNILAKKLIMEGNDAYFRDPFYAKKCHFEAYSNYTKKDRVTMAIMDILGYKDIEAYFVKLESENLNESLYEIVALNYFRVIFHSKDTRLLNRLRDKGVFCEGIKNSKIDDYINTRYVE